MCAGDVARPIYSKLFSSHFEPLSALNLLQENPLKDAWSTEIVQDARDDNKSRSFSHLEFVDHLEKSQNEPFIPVLRDVISLPKCESSNLAQKNDSKILNNFASTLFSPITSNLENAKTPIQKNANFDIPLEINANSLPITPTQNENSVCNVYLNATDSKSKAKCTEYFQVNKNFRKLCKFSRRKEKNINFSHTDRLRLARRRLRKKSEYRYCYTIRNPEKYFLIHIQKVNCLPIRRRYKNHIKRRSQFEFTFENFQRYLRNISDLHATDRKQTSGSNDKNFRFPGRKPIRRNSLSQISFGDQNKAQNDTKISQRIIGHEPHRTSMEEYYSSKFKTRRKSQEFCNESTRNTIKLIDKILDDEPYKKYSKPIKSSSFDRTSSKETSQLIVSQEKTRSHSTDLGCSYKSRMSNDSIIPTGLPRSISVLRRRSSSISRPASLDIPVEHHSSRYQSNLMEDPDHSSNHNDGMRCSLDDLLIGTDGRNDRHDGVNSFLERLDKVLSDVVEEETKKIVSMNFPCHPELYMDRNYVSSVSYLRRNPTARDAKGVNTKTQKIKRYKSTDYDMLERHKKCFTESKPYKPRILKTNSQSELVSLKNCYQVPRPKRRKKKAANKNEVEENGIKYKDDFEFYDSSSDRNQESSSEQESIEEMISSSLDKKGVREEHKHQLNVKHNTILNTDNVNSSFQNNNVDTVLPKQYNGIKESKQADDEDDTCYGSDQFGSDMMIERLDASKLLRQVKKFSKEYGENSIDSAYTGSREPTPDICSSGSELAIALPKPKLKYNAIKNEKVRSASFVNPTDTVVQRMNDAKLFLLEKIKDTGLYSDSNINSLLEYYSRKWHHIPEREMKIIAGFIRRDLGVKAPPKTYIDHLLKQSDTTQEFNKEFTTEECVTALSTTLPNYLKVFRDKRKAASTSCSPEPSIFFKSQPNLNNYSERYDCEPFVSKRYSEFRVSNKQSGKTPKFYSGITNEELESRKKHAKKGWSDTFQTTVACQRDDSENYGYSLLSNDYDDEEWIRNNVGKDVLDDVKRKISDINETEPDRKLLCDDVEKLANDMCERFGIVL